MKTNLTLNDIKLFTRQKFIKLLKSRGYTVKIIEGDDNYLTVSNISQIELKSICDTYGTSGSYDPESKSATIGRWGWGNGNNEDATLSPLYGITTLKRKFRELYNVEEKVSKLGVTLVIKNITELKFRKYLVDYGITNFMYNYSQKNGYVMIMFNKA